MPGLKGARLWQLAAAVWAAAIFVSGVFPTRETVSAVSNGHETVFTAAMHFAIYLVLGFLLGVALGGWSVDLRRLALGLAMAAVLGGGIELLQGPLPYRDTQIVDFVVDVVGSVAGLCLFSVVAASAARLRWRHG